jgi:hypothetical protein
MTVDLDDAAVDHGVFEVGVFGQGSEHTIECVSVDPSAKSLEDRVPLAELIGQVTPRAARPGNPQHRLDEQSRVRAGATGVAFPAKAVRGNERPLRVGQRHADQGHLPFGNRESLRSRFGNPQTSTDPSRVESNNFARQQGGAEKPYRSQACVRVVASIMSALCYHMAFLDDPHKMMVFYQY